MNSCSTSKEVVPLAHQVAYIAGLVAQGGPSEAQFDEFSAFLGNIYALHQSGSLDAAGAKALRDAFGEAFTPVTMQGFAYTKPHGYAGDYEIVDRIYQMHVSSDPRFAAWDLFWHAQAAPRSHRNRKGYFQALLDKQAQLCKPLRVLKLGVGPGRSMYEWLSRNPDADIRIHCLDIDPDAIAYATELNKDFLGKVTFQLANVIRYRPDQNYDLIWSGGLFDYFSDRVFVSVLRRLVSALAPGGELVLSNYSDYNPTLPHMFIIDWMVYQRTAAQLESLAQEAGVPQERITIGTEPEGVNFFLHVAG